MVRVIKSLKNSRKERVDRFIFAACRGQNGKPRMACFMELTQNFVETLIGNSSTAANGRKLAKSGMQNCRKSEDNTLIFGECKGSGKNPYYCSVDFINPANPVARCSCPSRQIPCKHAAGLLYLYLTETESGKDLPVGEIPNDVVQKRAKIEKRVENKKEREKKVIDISEPPSKQKVTSAKKRIGTQLDGIKNAESLIRNIVFTGLGSVDANMLKTLQNQLNELGNYHINGIQEAMAELLIRIKADDANFGSSIEQILFVNALLKKARTHLETKLTDDELVTRLSVDSEIEQQIGHVWKLDELKAYGCFESNTKLAQIAFYSYDNGARREFVDESYLLSLQSGEVFKKINYRPYKASKHVKADDTVNEIIVTEELFKYPGGINPRCRWNENTYKSFEMQDYAKIKSLAKDNFTDVVKAVKGQLKSPLSDKNPLALLSVAKVDNGCIIDVHGNKQALDESGYISDNTTTLLSSISPKLLENTAMLVMYNADLERNTLTAKPLTIIRDNGMTRLLY
jgi:hypothetical protein